MHQRYKIFLFYTFIASMQLYCIAQTCEKIGRCKCQMSDGSGNVNLESLAVVGASETNTGFVAESEDGWSYRYNPCIPFSSAPYSGLAILQISQNNIYDKYNLGIQASETFHYSSNTELSIRYEDDPYYPVRNSSVLLLCEREITEHIFEFLGELITTEYEFLLRGPCACPGVCDENGVIVTTAPATTTTPATTTPATTTTTTTKKGSFNWDHMGNTFVSLLFNDFLILVFVVAFAFVFRFFFSNLPQNNPPTKMTNHYSEA